MALTTQLSATTFGLLFTCTILSSWLAGSTFQWTLAKGLFEKRLFEKANQYNVLVAIAGTSSMIHTLLCFFNNLAGPTFGVGMSVVVNWTVMTNSSIMLVSQRLSLTFQNPQLAWKRLLWINYLALPCCILIGTSWAISHNVSNTPLLDDFVRIIEPIQIGVFGMIEFVLSGAFIVQMWKYRWTDVERHGMFMLFLVGACDLASVLLNLMMGDLESTCVKGLIYSLRIRLEVNVLCCMVDYIKNRRGRITYGTSSSNGTGTGSGTRGTRGTKRRTVSGYFAVRSGKRSSTKRSRFDSELDRLRNDMNSSASHTNGTYNHEQAPGHSHRRNHNKSSQIPSKIDNCSNFTAVSQLRSSTTESVSPPQPDDDEQSAYQGNAANDRVIIMADHSNAQEEYDSDGDSFTNDFFRQHYLDSLAEQDSLAQSKSNNNMDDSSINDINNSATSNKLRLTNDTVSTVPTSGAELSTATFHIVGEEEHNDPPRTAADAVAVAVAVDIENPPPFQTNTNTGAGTLQSSQPFSSHASDKTLLMNNSSSTERYSYPSAPFDIPIDTTEADRLHIIRTELSSGELSLQSQSQLPQSQQSIQNRRQSYTGQLELTLEQVQEQREHEQSMSSLEHEHENDQQQPKTQQPPSSSSSAAAPASAPAPHHSHPPPPPPPPPPIKSSATPASAINYSSSSSASASELQHLPTVIAPVILPAGTHTEDDLEKQLYHHSTPSSQHQHQHHHNNPLHHPEGGGGTTGGMSADEFYDCVHSAPEFDIEGAISPPGSPPASPMQAAIPHTKIVIVKSSSPER